MRLVANIDAYGRDVALVSVTAPGADVLPWTDEASPHRTVVPRAAYRWNATAPARWRRLHRLAAQRTRRRCGHFRVIARSWEYQRRGVLHLHVVLPMGTARDRHAAHVYVAALDSLRSPYGFGYVDRGKRGVSRKRTLEVIPPGAAAGYLAKYLAPRAEGGKLALTETVQRDDVPRQVVYIGRALTAKTRVTMRTLRTRRLAFVIARQRGAEFASVLEALLGEPPTLQLLYGTAAIEVRGP